MRYLSLDIGDRHTGITYLDTLVGIPLPLDTLHHTSGQQLVDAVLVIVRERKVETVLVGLPRLPSGEEGLQATQSRKIGDLLLSRGIAVEYVDERFTTPRSSQHKNALPTQNIDGDATAACALLSQKIDH